MEIKTLLPELRKNLRAANYGYCKKLLQSISLTSHKKELNRTEQRFIDTINKQLKKIRIHNNKPAVHSVFYNDADNLIFIYRTVCRKEKTRFRPRTSSDFIVFAVIGKTGIKDYPCLDSNFYFTFSNRYGHKKNLSPDFTGNSHLLSCAVVLYQELTSPVTLKKNVFATGGIDSRGMVTIVNPDSFNEKLRIMLAESGKNDIILVPAGNYNKLKDKIKDKRIYPVTDLNSALDIVFGDKRKQHLSPRYRSNARSFYDYIDRHFYEASEYYLSELYFTELYNRLFTDRKVHEEYLTLYVRLLNKLILCSLHRNDINAYNSWQKEYRRFYNKYKKSPLFDFNIAIENACACSVALQDTFKFDEAISILKDKISEKYFSCLSPEIRLNLYNTLGQAYMFNSEYPKAEKIFNMSLTGCPAERISRTLNYRANNYIYWGRYKQAESDLCRSLKLDRREKVETLNPVFAGTYLSKLFFNKKEYQKSIRRAENTLKLTDLKKNPYPAALNYKYAGLSYIALCQIEKGKDLLDKGITFFLSEVKNDIQFSLFYLIAVSFKTSAFLINPAIYDFEEIYTDIMNSGLVPDEIKNARYRTKKGFIKTINNLIKY